MPSLPLSPATKHSQENTIDSSPVNTNKLSSWIETLLCLQYLLLWLLSMLCCLDLNSWWSLMVTVSTAFLSLFMSHPCFTNIMQILLLLLLLLPSHILSVVTMETCDWWLKCVFVSWTKGSDVSPALPKQSRCRFSRDLNIIKRSDKCTF